MVNIDDFSETKFYFPVFVISKSISDVYQDFCAVTKCSLLEKLTWSGFHGLMKSYVMLGIKQGKIYVCHQLIALC